MTKVMIQMRVHYHQYLFHMFEYIKTTKNLRVNLMKILKHIKFVLVMDYLDLVTLVQM